MAKQRTDLAEEFIAQFASIPLTAECIYHSPKYLDRGKEKELCDMLIVLRGKAILISMKTQQEPWSKGGDRLVRWVVKNAEVALRQARGALRTISRSHVWCTHNRRGRVDFAPGALEVIHVIVLTELVHGRVQLPRQSKLTVGAIPVTYLSTNDFCNLVENLRTFGDLDVYLNMRRKLPEGVIRAVGGERAFFEFYILNKESLSGCTGYEHACITAAAREQNFLDLLDERLANEQHARLIEFVSDSLAERLANHAEGLDASTCALFDDSTVRSKYLRMQEELCDLRLLERTHIGMRLAHACQKVVASSRAENMCYGAALVDAKPDFVYVLISSKGVERGELIKRANVLLWVALSNYKKGRGMAIVDRDGKGFEIVLIEDFEGTATAEELGKKFFADLKISSVTIRRAI